jgi:aminoglycoside phosphotransferase (APT) family kinase protein
VARFPACAPIRPLPLWPRSNGRSPRPGPASSSRSSRSEGDERPRCTPYSSATATATDRRSSGPIPAPTLVALDAHAAATDEPALLMTRLPGRLCLQAGGRPDALRALAEMLVAIHRIAPPERDRPRSYQSWAVPERRVVPAWARDPRVWQRALRRIDVEPPPYCGCFLHRDFHLGNVLFDGAAVSGVVDWVETSWGRPDLDVAHCGTALALLEGPTAGERMRTAYRAAGGGLASDPAA